MQLYGPLTWDQWRILEANNTGVRVAQRLARFIAKKLMGPIQA